MKEGNNRVMLRYSDTEFGYAVYEGGNFAVRGKAYTPQDLIENKAVVVTSDPEIVEEMKRIGAPVQDATKPRIVSASLSAETYEALRGAVKASGMRQSNVADYMYKFFIRSPKLFADFVHYCQRNGLYPEDELSGMLEEWMKDKE